MNIYKNSEQDRADDVIDMAREETRLANAAAVVAS